VMPVRRRCTPNMLASNIALLVSEESAELVELEISRAC